MGDRVFDKLANPKQLKKSPILVFAADASVAYGITGIGTERTPTQHYRTRPEFLRLMRDVMKDEAIDGLLMTPADAEELAIEQKLFDDSPVTPIVRMNAETHIWSPRHGRYGRQTSLPFQTVPTAEAGRYCTEAMQCALDCKIKLGLYSITLNNDTEADARTTEQFLNFAWDCGKTPDFNYFLEVFLPNTQQPGMDKKQLGEYMADNIVRLMSYLRKHQRPAFIKTVYTVPEVWKALCEFDPTLIIGALGGSRVSARHTLQLAHDVTEHGGKVLLFGRAIFQEEDPKLMARMVRAVMDRELAVDHAHAQYQATVRARL